MSQVWKMWNL